MIVDEVIDRLFDIDRRANHPRLLQRDAGFENGFALRCANLVVGELGALLELLVHHVAVELGHSDKNLLELVVMGERVSARLLVGGEHARNNVGVILGEFFAGIEDTPGIRRGIPVE